MSKSLHSKICQDLSSREDWENKQRIWLEMRNQGLRRQNKPFAGAADLHFPLIDSIIEKTKPFYAQQLVSNELLASFVSLKPQPTEFSTASARFFDYSMRYRSEFITETMFAVDHMLQSGKGIVKVYWDTNKKQLGFDSIEPMYIVVPSSTKSLGEADRITHIMHVSAEEYKRNKLWDQDEGLIKRISGKGPDDTVAYEEEKLRRDGITECEDPETIVVWEVYERQQDRSILIHTFSPLDPETPIRPKRQLHYKNSKPGQPVKMPFVAFAMELKGKGWYDARGIAEIVAPFETSACKMWNDKHDFMSFVNRPLFTSAREIPNVSSISIRPGSIIPGGLERVDLGNPPFALDQELEFNRSTAESRIGQPDYAMQRGGKEARTATEVEQVSQMSMQSTDLRAILFRLSLTEIFLQSWFLLLQFDQETQFLYDSSLTELPLDAKHDAYQIEPSGNVDSWNKSLQTQKAWLRFNTFKDNPFINQGELAKSLLVLDDPKLVRTLYQDPQIAAADQYEDEVYEIMAMIEMGYPVRVKPSDDHAARLRCDAQFIQSRALKGQPLMPEQEQIIRAHMQQHMQALQQVQPQAAKQIGAELQQMAAQAQQQMAMLSQVQQMQAQPQAMPQPQLQVA